MRLCAVLLAVAGLTTGCVAAEKPATAGIDAPATSYAGWYMEHAGQATFQPCGQAQPWRITEPADLPARARAFGLEPDTPVYVRLSGAAAAGAIAVTTVEQFGSPTPVRNCALNGVVIPAPTP